MQIGIIQMILPLKNSHVLNIKSVEVGMCVPRLVVIFLQVGANIKVYPKAIIKIVANIIAGYILWLERKKYFRLYSLAISNGFQNRGLAKKLLEYSFENLSKDNKDFSLEVKVSNESAINLYKKYGFEIKKILKDYYEQCHGYLMYKKCKAQV